MFPKLELHQDAPEACMQFNELPNLKLRRKKSVAGEKIEFLGITVCFGEELLRRIAELSSPQARVQGLLESVNQVGFGRLLDHSRKAEASGRVALRARLGDE